MDNKSGSGRTIIAVLITAIISSGVTFAYVNRMYNPESRYFLSFNRNEVEKSDIDKFSEVWELLKDNFLYDADERKMFEGAIAGIARGLNDPYTMYYTVEQMELLKDYSSSTYVGVGLIVNENKDGILEVVEPVKNGPAFSAGIMKGDLIIRVNGEDITLGDIDFVIGKIKGEEGSEVIVTTYRPSEYKYIDFKLIRTKIHLPSVKSDILETGIGYIRISMFDTMVANDFYNELNALLKKGIKGLVLDLRDNPGGSYDQVVSIADMLLPDAVILYTEDKSGNRKYEKSKSSHLNIPLTVLVNGHSASASEVLAGALQDNGRAEIVGTQTFGKGVVQVIVPLDDGSGLKMTISGYYTPAGHIVQGVGITPDRVVEQEKEYEGSPVSVIPTEKDYQLQAALEVLKGKMKN